MHDLCSVGSILDTASKTTSILFGTHTVASQSLCLCLHRQTKSTCHNACCTVTLILTDAVTVCNACFITVLLKCMKMSCFFKILVEYSFLDFVKVVVASGIYTVAKNFVPISVVVLQLSFGRPAKPNFTAVKIP